MKNYTNPKGKLTNDDGRIMYRTGGCGCCTVGNILTKDMLVEHISELDKAKKEAEGILKDWESHMYFQVPREGDIQED